MYHVQGANRSSAADTVACRSAMFEFRDRLRVLQERDVLREESGPGSETDAAIKGFDGTTTWCCVLISSAPSMRSWCCVDLREGSCSRGSYEGRRVLPRRRRRGGFESQDGLGGGQLSCDRQTVLLSAIATVEICGLHITRNPPRDSEQLKRHAFRAPADWSG